MHVAVVANGELPAGYESAVQAVLETADITIAADGGVIHCRAVGIWPDVLVGDLDSAPAELVKQAQRSGVHTIEHPADKDETDLDLALAHAVGAGATEVTIIAAFGGRLDHELATIGLIAGPALSQARVSATDGRRQMWVVRDQLQLSLDADTTVSLLPWGGEATGVSVSGVKWPLTEATLPLGSTLGVSNVAVDPDQLVTILAGTLLVISDLD